MLHPFTCAQICTIETAELNNTVHGAAQLTLSPDGKYAFLYATFELPGDEIPSFLLVVDIHSAHKTVRCGSTDVGHCAHSIMSECIQGAASLSTVDRNLCFMRTYTTCMMSACHPWLV